MCYHIQIDYCKECGCDTDFTCEQVVEDIHAYNQLGVSELIFDFRSETLSESLDRMEHFATIVKPAVGI